VLRCSLSAQRAQLMHIVECLTHSKLGGGQSVVFNLVRQLRTRHPDIHFTIVLPPEGHYVERFRGLGVDVAEFQCDTIAPWRLARAARLLRSLQPDVVHSHGKGAGLYARSLPKGAFRRVHSFHGFHPPEERVSSAVYHAVESYLLSHTDAVIAVSHEEGDEIRRAFARAKEKVIPIPNVVDCDELAKRSDAALPSSIASFLSLNASHFIISMIGRNDPVKNYPLAFDAARIVFQQTLQCCFVFVGIDKDDHACGELMQRFPENVFAIPLLENPAPLIKKSNAVMLTSKKEGSPLVVQEAFCLGKPVIGTNVPGIREVVEDGVNGVLCAENAEAVAQAIGMLAGDKEKYKGLSQQARATASSKNIAAWAELYYNVYLGRGK
jgi:glycosyltransferase involved in cell wall biosynthesis